MNDIYNVYVNAPINLLFMPKKLRTNCKYFYDYKVSENDFSSHGLILREVEPNKKILDVGCTNGILGEYLIKNKNCEVFGIDLEETALKIAKDKGYKNTKKLDLDDSKELLDLEEWGKFDYIICADVLEHTKNINKVFLFLFDMLNQNGKMLVSIPNIGHIDIIYHLLKGEFNYAPMGILDNTHLRFFTKKSFFNWVQILLDDNNKEYEIKFIGNTKYFKLEEYNKNDMKYKEIIEKNLIKLAKKFGYYEDLYVLQNIFSIIKK